jgi:hypothetical protein
VATITSEVIRSAVVSLDALIQQAGLSPDANRVAVARSAVAALSRTLPTDVGGQAAGGWADLDEATQKRIFDQLDSLRDDLMIEVSPNGLKGSRMLMSSNPAPSSVILFLLILAIAGTGGVLSQIHSRWEESTQGTGSPAQRQSAFTLARSFAEQASQNVQALETAVQSAEEDLRNQGEQSADADATSAARAKVDAAKKRLEAAKTNADERWTAAVRAENLLGPPQKAVILMVVLLGALGGLIHLASSLTMYVGNRDLKRSWIIYYLLAPLQGAALAPLLYLLLTSAVLSPQYAGGAGTENLNLTAIYAFAGLTGLFAKQAIEKLADVFATLFSKIQARDTTRSEAEVR